VFPKLEAMPLEAIGSSDRGQMRPSWKLSFPEDKSWNDRVSALIINTSDNVNIWNFSSLFYTFMQINTA
jgi:hypothetical protein